jgi:hypothetical protein
MHTIDCCPINARAVGLTPDGTHLIALDDMKLIAVPLDCGPIIDLNHELLVKPSQMEVVRSRKEVGKCYLLLLAGDKIEVREVDLVKGIGPELKSIDLDADGLYAQHNAWAHLSPDGLQFAITEFNSNIKLYHINTGEVALITTELGTIQSLRWSWDGRWIYCQGLHGKDDSRWLARVDARTGAVSILWQAQHTMLWGLLPAPDGKTLVAGRLKMGVDLFMMDGL